MATTWPDLAAFELLVVVGRTGSLSSAARELGVAQPNASRTLARLERRLGVTLVQRSPSGSVLTDQGQLVAHWAHEALEATTRLLVGAEALHRDRRTHLTVAASMTIAEHLAPAWLGELRREHTATAVQLDVLNSRDVLARLRDGEVELGFIETPRLPRGMASATVGKDTLVVVVTPGHPWTRRRRVLTRAELAATPLVVREAGSGTRTTLEETLAEYDQAPPLLELASANSVRTAAASGMAPAVVSTLSIGSAVDTGELVLVPLEGEPITRTLRAVWRSRQRPTGPAGDLLRIATRRH